MHAATLTVQQSGLHQRLTCMQPSATSLEPAAENFDCNFAILSVPAVTKVSPANNPETLDISNTLSANEEKQ
jgi:hypothetical protein